jgi:GH24 family phage-related lysozyme (muramidase)
MNLKLIIKEELSNSYKNRNNILETEYYLDRIINKLLLISETEWLKDEPSPTYHWDIEPELEKDLDSSKDWVKTKEDVLEYLDILLKKLKNISKPLKVKIIKYVLASFLGILTLTQVKTLEKEVEKSGDIKNMSLAIKPKVILKDQKIRKPSQTLFKHLKKEEGIGGKPVLYFYNLGDGAYTTGYGHAVFSNPERGSTGGDYSFVPDYEDIIPYDRKNPNKKITRISAEQAEKLLQDDMLEASEGVNTILDEWEAKGIKPKITQGMYDAMVSIAYNHGVGNLRMSKFIQYVKRSEFENAKEEIKNISSNMFDQYPGLKTRREKESNLFMS